MSVVLCDDAHITTLNATHRGKAAPTDVLSFELEDDLDYKVGGGVTSGCVEWVAALAPPGGVGLRSGVALQAVWSGW